MSNIMAGINSYGTTLNITEHDINTQKHRQVVGGLWEELGALQFNFMLEQGLKPHHRLLDLGCGCLRGGVKFIDFLNKSNYVGIDINDSLLSAGRLELEKYNLVDKTPQLLRSDVFGLDFNVGKFDFAISVSLFTHLPISYIQEALFSIKSKLSDDGAYFSTFFVCDDFESYFSSITHLPGGITTHAHKNPFHFNIQLIDFVSKQVGLKCIYIGDWNHPRNQKMFKFEHV